MGERMDMYDIEKAFGHVSDFVHSYTGCSLPLGVWNDASDTKRREVFNLLDMAINQLKGEDNGDQGEI